MQTIPENISIDGLRSHFATRYLEILKRQKQEKVRTYGFEYEFLPSDPLDVEDLLRIWRVLVDMGFKRNGDEFITDKNIRISFEPGGQIEYQSPPMKSNDHALFESVLQFMNHTNAEIKRQLGIEYIATGYIPGRDQAPLCLRSPRYAALHERLRRTGSRGLEMMKGTASIHLHVMITSMHTLLALFYQLCKLAMDSHFRMSPERRDIWDHTDPTRCGMPPCCFETLSTPEALVERLIDFALMAEVLGEDVCFWQSKDRSFEAFLYHMTTLFTDIRFNLKGPTLELRTLDSMPVHEFHKKWELFVSTLETI